MIAGSRGSCLGMAQHCVVLSPQEESRLRSLLPRMDVFRSQLPVQRLSTRDVSKSQARESLGISKDAVVLLFFGIIRPYKGLKILLEALGALALQGIKPTLIIAGEFWEDEQGYRQQISRLNLAAQVFIDNRFVPNEVSALYYSAADYMTAPYIGGTQSSVLRAAMDYGLPIIASESIVSDLPQDHYPLFTHKAGDADDLTRVLTRVLSAPIPPVMRPENSANLMDLVHWIESISPDNANG